MTIVERSPPPPPPSRPWSACSLNLPEDLQSHGLREMAAVESARGSFDKAKAAIDRASGTSVADRAQVAAVPATGPDQPVDDRDQEGARPPRRLYHSSGAEILILGVPHQVEDQFDDHNDAGGPASTVGTITA